MLPRFRLCLILTLAALPAFAGDSPGLRDTTILVIRHAEKPPSGYALSNVGQLRALAYCRYFREFTIDSQPLKLDYLIATTNSAGSHRPYLTIEPLSKVLHLPIDNRFKDREFQQLADELLARPHGKQILICWHHGEIPQLLAALGADPKTVLPDGEWPEKIFGWVIQLRYDANGRLLDAKRINENLLPDDSDTKK